MNHLEGTTGRAVDPNGVDHPTHYNQHPSGVEVIEIVRHLDFNLGSAVKYILREGLKGESDKDLNKALWYMRDEHQNVDSWSMPDLADSVGAKFLRIVTTEPDPQKSKALGLIMRYAKSRQKQWLELALTVVREYVHDRSKRVPVSGGASQHQPDT